MDEPKLNFFTKIYYSITSFDKYRYFLRQSVGRAVAYLLLLALALGTATLVPAAILYNNVIDEVTAGFDSTVPDFKLENGKLSVSGPMPIIIDGEGMPVVIDTTPGAEERILGKYDTVLLITADKIIQKNYVNKSSTDLKNLYGIVLTKDSVKQALPLMKPLGIFIFLFGGIFYIASKFVSALIISLAGMIINSSMKLSLSYRSIFKISVYSLTLPALLCTVLDLLPVLIPFKWALFYIIAAVYVYGAMSSIRKEIDKTDGGNMYGNAG